MRGGTQAQAAVAWANTLETATQEIFRHLGLDARRDDQRSREVSWATAAGLSAALECLMIECDRRGLALDDLAAVVHDERQQVARHLLTRATD